MLYQELAEGTLVTFNLEGALPIFQERYVSPQAGTPHVVRGGSPSAFDRLLRNETGTGKTLAFLLPIFRRMKLGGAGPQAMVICPTRELAMQVAGEAERFGEAIRLRRGCREGHLEL